MEISQTKKKKQALAVALSRTGWARDSMLDLNEGDGMTKLDSVFLKEEKDRGTYLLYKPH